MVGTISPPLVVNDLVRFGSGFVAVGSTGVYLTDTLDELKGNWCGIGGSWEGSCRTDAAVWIGTWLED